ncbi:hypothetical protein Agub_g9346 [Astrephomene gubernaculifera]|uniref:Uncharacterized protein n=1 Tax=Astrephomene gubernaculifera TaxID=47775 RepID=A0AAD3DT64_9CHLO|nr:hypothetical protein Agub_g9346 [Astrephomene gubernaculifera]
MLQPRYCSVTSGRTKALPFHPSRPLAHGCLPTACSVYRKMSKSQQPIHGQVAASAQGVATEPQIASSVVTQEARRAVFEPAKEQYPEAEALVISGRLPSWLSGSLLLNGCGDYRGGMRHLFDGFACLTRVRLDGGRGSATASQRFLESDAYRSFRRTGRLKYREFATPVPAEGPVGRAMAVAGNLVTLMSGGRAFTDNASVSLTPLPGGRLLALSEARSATFLVDPVSLATLQHVSYSDVRHAGTTSPSPSSSWSPPAAPAGAKDTVPGDLTTAHPKVAPDGQTLVNFARTLPYGGYHVYLQDPVTLARREIAFIRDRDPLSPCWVHDMALSRRHLVIVEPPLFMSLPSLVLGRPRPFVFMDWRPAAGTRVHVVALDGSGVVTHTAPPLFTFHFANAFERPATAPPPGSSNTGGGGSASEICVDFSVYDDPEILNDLSLERLQDFPGKDISPSRLRRLLIPLTDAAGRPVGPSSLAAPVPLLRDEDAYGNFIEFPAFNPRFRGLPYRYVYGTAAVRPTNMGNALARHDLAGGSSKLWHEPGGMPAEPIFVPRPGGTAEEDGVVLSVVTRPDGCSMLLVLDGGSWREVARVALPVGVPYRFHGAWVAEEGGDG